MAKKIFWVLLVAFIVIQFFKPAKNKSEGTQLNNIEALYPIPADVKTILQKACNDCHSNNTSYPWYNNIQPVAWWLEHHVNEGKRELNLDEFANTSLRRQYHKLEEIEEQIKKGDMPLPSYTWIHKDAVLTDAEKNAVYAWVSDVRGKMEAAYPMDSLVRKK
ncbi:MAG: heme-binding domain-containing protein [Niabella sp.]